MVESRQPEVLAIVCVFTVVAFIFVATRTYSRYLGRNFAWDDYLIILAFILLLADTIATWQYILLSGTGYHTWDLPKKSINQQLVALRWNFAVQMFYHPLFWLNIFYSVGTSFVNILQCKPTRYTWTKPAMDYVDAEGNTVAGGTCIDSRTFVLTSCALSIFMDLIIIPIPSIMVWNLQMSRRTKTLVVIVMSLGWIATGVSVGRFIVYYYRIAPTNKDRTWNIGIGISIAEPAVHIMTACAPATKCLFRYMFPSFGTKQTPDYYEDRHSTQITRPSKSISRTSRGLGNFSFGLSNNGREDNTVELGTGVRISRVDLKSESVYDLKPRSSVETTERTDGEGDERRSLEVLEPTRTSCSKTAYTAGSEPVEAEPKHCLGQAR
ncbi:Nn.00g023540.m01.CDS01 [Neocucurbitaria sp. VM-36]